MPNYKVLSPISCGQRFEIGDTVPDGTLSDREVKALIKLGVIQPIESPIPVIAPPPENPAPPPPTTGKITDPVKILEYVNSADQAGLERIKKVGTSTAKAMISHGKFSSIDELKELVANVDWNKIEVIGNK